MLPDFTIRINNLIKAMEKTIIPALDPKNGLAQEQAALLIGHLKILNEQIDGAYVYECGSYRNMVTLAANLLRAIDGGTATQAAASDLNALLCNLPEQLPLTPERVNQLTTALGTAVDNLINSAYQDGTAAAKGHVFDSVLNYNNKQSARERIWFKGNNLDPDTRDLGSMEELLFSNRYEVERLA
jgi:hypothetical protein